MFDPKFLSRREVLQTASLLGGGRRGNIGRRRNRLAGDWAAI